MSPQASGIVVDTAAGRDLVLKRDLKIPVGESWSWISDSQKLELWFGTWSGAGEAGGRIDVTMNAEAEPHTSEWEILGCESGSSYEIRSIGGVGWHLELKVEQDGKDSRLTFIHHLDDGSEVGQIGAGWEYYLDRLLAAIEDREMPDFDQYWPAMGPYYEKAG